MHTRAMLVLLIAVMAGCGGVTTRKPPIEVFPDMDRQPKYKPQAASSFFSDGRASRSAVAGTVAIGQLPEDSDLRPPATDAALMARGQERYDIYCAVCHDRTGSGRGIVTLRVPAWLATNLHDERIRQMGDAELFQVVTEGRRTMPAYRFQVPVKDRWAIVAYVRALQRARQGTLADVPPEVRASVR